MGISLRAYARHRKVSAAAVHKAIATGRITLEPDGTIDPERADIEWENNTRLRIGSKTRTVKADESVFDDTQPISGEVSFLQAKIANETIKAKINELKLEQLRGELVNRAQAVAHVFKLARAEREAWINWPSRVAPTLAAELKVDEHALLIALDKAVRKHLEELAEIVPKVD